MFTLRLLILGLLFAAVPVTADTEAEINHLLGFVAATDCQYERNGNMYSGLEAREHIQRKYRYFEKKVKTTEDFIRLSATKSTVSGKRYGIHCSGMKSVFASDWLLDELGSYRQSQALEQD